MTVIMEYSNKILELVENQMRNDNDTLTQSDLQGVAEAIILSVYLEGKKDK